MIKLGPIAIVIFSVLLTGCATKKCPAPGYPSTTNHSCYYMVTVTSVDPMKDEVTGTIAIPDKGSKFYTEAGSKSFTFPVRDVQGLQNKGRLEKGKTYLFTNGYHSPSLEPFKEGYAFDKK